MARHPFSYNWKAPVAFIVVATVAFVAFLVTNSYLLAIGTLLFATIGYGIYGMGESSDLPGTAGKDDKNVPT